MSKHVACLTFDFDVWSGWASRSLLTPTPMSRGEFGLVAAPRLLKLLAKYGIRSTWCIPGIIIESHPEICRAVADAGHEIAHHGYSHLPPAALSPEQEEADLVRASALIENLCGRRPRGYRSPAWDLSTATVELLLRHGFDYESSMMANDHHPYFVRKGDRPSVDGPLVMGEATRLVEMPVSWTLDDYPHFEFVRTASYVIPGLMNARSVFQNWIDDFRYMTQIEDWGVLTYTFHPYVIGRGHRMLALEALIGQFIELGATFQTLGATVDEFLERQPGEAAR